MGNKCIKLGKIILRIWETVQEQLHVHVYIVSCTVFEFLGLPIFVYTARLQKWGINNNNYYNLLFIIIQIANDITVIWVLLFWNWQYSIQIWEFRNSGAYYTINYYYDIKLVLFILVLIH